MQAANSKEKENADYLAEKYLSKLGEIRKNSGDLDTKGLLDSEILQFLSSDSTLKDAVIQAYDYHIELRNLVGHEILMKSEKNLVKHLQEGFVNFYANRITFERKIIFYSGGHIDNQSPNTLF